AVAWVCFWTILALGVFDRLVYWDLLPPDWTASFLEMNQRRHFGPLHLLAFAAALFFASWVVTTGLTDRNPVLRLTGRMVHGVVSQPMLIFLGQHSLQVFAFQMLLVYALALVFRDGPPGELLGTLILLTCAASLYIPARLHALYQSRKKIAVGA
ncbi:MAG: OpgC domain-containing protein, partial [Sandaracinobacteroides sp.]